MKRKNFSLIELLVVIAIIAILAGMLLPVLKQVQVKAHSISCVNNLKQVMLVGQMYLNDNRDIWPATSLNHKAENWSWSLAKNGYIREKEQTASKSFLRCPTLPWQDLPGETNAQYQTYGSVYMTNDTWLSTYGGIPFREKGFDNLYQKYSDSNPIGKVSPSQKIWFADSVLKTSSGKLYQSQWLSHESLPLLHMRHGTCGNVGTLGGNAVSANKTGLRDLSVMFIRGTNPPQFKSIRILNYANEAGNTVPLPW